ncbi:MAG: MinD/ParA family protein [Acidobacteriota bacterium]|jgi:flagellar biosynthesis protein FlhG|nr:MinD/ParA family protein [Acidobacteriota bacterium]
MTTSYDSLLENTDERQGAAAGLLDADGAPHKTGVRHPRVIAVTSGKGGVGKTNLVANLSVGLSELGRKVVVLDADFGLANLDVMLGLAPRYHLGHVLYGDKSLHEIMVPGPRGIHIIPASSGLQRMSELTQAQRKLLIDSFTHLDMDVDYFIIDTAAGISRNVIHFLLSSEEVLVVSAPEPTAIVDAYAIIKIILGEDREKPIQVVINSVEKVEEAHEVFCQINSVVKRFLGREIDYLGHIERDAHVMRAVKSQMPVTHRFPNAPASVCFRDLARRIAQREAPSPTVDGLVWERLLNDWVN